MNGHSNELAILENILWTDAELEAVSIDYDAVRLAILESSGQRKAIRCSGYIGYNLLGFWDEIIIERVELHDSHSIIDACIQQIYQRLGTGKPESGNDDRNSENWRALMIHFIDGAKLEIVATRFSIEG